MTKLYLVGSLRNARIPLLARRLRLALPSVEIFDDWYAAGPEADDFWKEYEKERGRSYEEALSSHAAKHVFAFDKHHLDSSSHVLLVLPAGKSGHMELMYAAYGVQAKTAILLDEEDVRWDVMYQFIPTIIRKETDVIQWVQSTRSDVVYERSSEIDRYKDRAEELGKLFARGGYLAGRVPHGGRAAGLLPERSSGDSSTLEASGRQASSGGASALGEVEKYGSPEQDTPASCGQREAGQGRPSTFHWLGVEGVG